MNVLEGGVEPIPPVWLMRQAGRYLPEYRETRKKAGSFLNLCYSPELAIEVTLQPIRRFGFDASILFSDILVIPDALGQRVEFKEGEGPVLEPLSVDAIQRLNTETFLDHLKPVLETVSGLRTELPSETTLIGFCGAPWTVATYMIAGRGSPDQAAGRKFALQHSDHFQKLIDCLVDASSQYLVAQLKAGADTVQIFDSWAGILGGEQFDRWCVEPVKKIIGNVCAEIPEANIIAFPRMAGTKYDDYRQRTGSDAIGLDWTVPLEQAKALQKEGAVQGLLDPVKLIVGGDALDREVDRILEVLSDGPFIFNLGHGITPETPISHVEQLLKRIRG